MSGSAVPYSLRQNKFVDRRIFLDLPMHVARWIQLDESVYIGMGGNALEDHKLLHAHLGLSRMISIDMDEHVVARQNFNKPISSIHCIETETRDFIPVLRSELQRLGLDGNSRVIVWFDYTDPNDVGAQINEFVQLINTMGSGDVVRITVNAHPPSLCDSRDPRLPDRTPETLWAHRLETLEARLGVFMPPDVQPDAMVPDGLARVILDAFRLASLNAFPAEDPNYFQPLSAVRYADGQQMLSITGIILEKHQRADFLSKTGLSNWAYMSETWEDLSNLEIPDLTLRERLLLDQTSPEATPEQISSKLGFQFHGKQSRTAEVVEQYRKHGRFYPHFHYVPT